jgi:hypothetical protein
MRQALAGMLWTKQYFYYDVAKWLSQHGLDPTRDAKTMMRNRDWHHMINEHIVSMPDKWEYPWYAAWDLAFHTVPLAMVDPDFAKEQLELMLNEKYLHPNGQMPAYEWNFGDVNPPVHAWAIWFVYQIDRELHGGTGDAFFLEQSFQKLLLNFTWWVNRKDIEGNNLFGGGFLGLDNIGVFDRSSPLPTGGYLEQADGTGWVAFFSSMMLRMAIELAVKNPVYETMATKFFDHFMRIASAMDRIGDHKDELWDEEDGFHYDVLHFPDGSATRIKVRSMVGLLSLFATTVFPRDALQKLPRFTEEVKRMLAANPGLVRALLSLYQYYGNDFKVECPTGSGIQMTLYEVAQDISARLAGIFVADASGRRAVFGDVDKFQTDPHWRDHILFYEYFDGENGRGIGASHQTGWTGCVAKLMQLFASTSADDVLTGLGRAGVLYEEPAKLAART